MLRAAILTATLAAWVLASSASFAAMTDQTRSKFVAQCQKQMYMSKAQCTCMADIASQKLDDTAIAYLSLDALDVTHSAAMSKSMTAGERNSIDHFMSTAPKQCKSAK
jgi:hypothetical protein